MSDDSEFKALPGGSPRRFERLRSFFSGIRPHTHRERFVFLDPGRMVDGELELVLWETRDANAKKGYVPGYLFHMIRVGEPYTIMGRISMRVGSTEHVEMYAGHIGYSVEPPYRGRRLAARACNLLFPLAKAHGLNPVWITCNPENTASRRTCEILGATLVEVVPVPRTDPLYAPDTRWKCRYRVDF